MKLGDEVSALFARSGCTDDMDLPDTEQEVFNSIESRVEELAKALAVELLEESTVEVPIYLVDTTVHFAKLSKMFHFHDAIDNDDGEKAESVSPRPGCLFLLLSLLHGQEGELVAKMAAAKVIEKLSVEMNEAWVSLDEDARAALLSVPSESDGEPKKVGEWTTNTSRWRALDGIPSSMLRPVLRQKLPPAGSTFFASRTGANFEPLTGPYIPDHEKRNDEKTNDSDGQVFVEEWLIPEAKRVLGALEELCRDVASEVGGIEVHTPPLKTAIRIAEKCGGIGEIEADHNLHEFPQQASNVDVARVMMKVRTPCELLAALEALRKKGKVLRIKNRFGNENGVKDMLLNLEVDGVIVEVQMGLLSLIEVRQKMHKFYNVARSEGAFELVKCQKVEKYWLEEK